MELGMGIKLNLSSCCIRLNNFALIKPNEHAKNAYRTYGSRSKLTGNFGTRRFHIPLKE